MSARVRAVVLALAGVFTATGTHACSLYAGGETLQCEEDDDCLALGPDFAKSGCAKAGLRAGFCVDTHTYDATGECSANADCVDIRGPGSVCARGGDGIARCVGALSAACPIVVGDPFVEGTVLFGVVGDVTTADPGYARDHAHLAGAQVALEDLQAGRGIELPGKRRVALVACSQSRARAAGAHLAALGAKAIVGPTDEGALTRLTEGVGRAKVPIVSGTLGDLPAAIAPEAVAHTTLTGPSRAGIVGALNAYLAEAGPELRNALGAVRVAVVLGRGNELLSQALAERLVFNGKTAIVNQNDPACGGCYRTFDTSQSTAAQIAADIARFEPTVIVPLTDTVFGAEVLPALEARFVSSTTKPAYVHVAIAEEDPGYRIVAAADTGFRRRFTGLWPARDESAFASFRERYRRATASRANTEGPEPTFAAARAYDATTLLFYATYAALQRGTSVAASIADVTARGARRVGPGPLDAPAAIAELGRSSSAKIDLDGLLTTYDGVERVHPTRWQVVCLDTFHRYAGTARTLADGGTFEGGPPVPCR